MPGRAALYARLGARFEEMIALGALDEVRAFVAAAPPSALPAWKALGVRELSAYLAREVSLDAACEAAKANTRRFAKRQFTWLRHHTRPEFVLNAQYSESLRCEILSFIRGARLTAGG
jgi:tRNA dimethylallyltransferase